MSMKNEFGGKKIGTHSDGSYTLWSVLVEHDGTKFLVDVWAASAIHAMSRLAVVASARYMYRALDVAPWAPCDIADLETA